MCFLNIAAVSLFWTRLICELQFETLIVLGRKVFVAGGKQIIRNRIDLQSLLMVICDLWQWTIYDNRIMTRQQKKE